MTPVQVFQFNTETNLLLTLPTQRSSDDENRRMVVSRTCLLQAIISENDFSKNTFQRGIQEKTNDFQDAANR